MFQLQGAVITDNNEDMMAISAMFLQSLPLRQIWTAHYNLVYEINFRRAFDFIMVRRLETIAQVIIHFRRNYLQVPHIIHLADPRTLSKSNYESRFPGVSITAIPQANLDVMDVTLRYDRFQNAIEALINDNQHIH